MWEACTDLKPLISFINGFKQKVLLKLPTKFLLIRRLAGDSGWLNRNKLPNQEVIVMVSISINQRPVVTNKTIYKQHLLNQTAIRLHEDKTSSSSALWWLLQPQSKHLWKDLAMKHGSTAQKNSNFNFNKLIQLIVY